MSTPAEKKVYVSGIELPKTKKNLEEQAKKELQERQQEELKRQEKKISEEQQSRIRAEEWERNKRKHDLEKQKQEADLKKQEADIQRSSLEGRLAKLINDLGSNSTSFETTLSGVEMGSIRWGFLAVALETNTSLRDLHIVRKGLNDEDGEVLLTSIKKNKSIEKLELQGNNLGKKTARCVGEMLAGNDMMKYLSLEGNDLYDKDLKDYSGIIEIANGIKKNNCLVALNISYCNLEQECGRILAEALRENEVIIDFDIRGNDFSLDVKRDINASLKRNKQIYDAERLMVWNERKAARKEDEYNEMIYITLEQENMKKTNIMTREEASKREKEMRWEEERLKKDAEMKREMEKLLNEAKKRLEGARKKKGRGGKKKK